MESEYKKSLNKIIETISFTLLILGIVLLGWFFIDWIAVAMGGKPDFDIFTISSASRPIVGIVCIIGFIFGRMLENREIESIPKRA